jgi:hypothetical protein
MPIGTKVHSIFDALKMKGMAVGKAAAISQAKSHQSLATGKKLPPKKKKGKK